MSFTAVINNRPVKIQKESGDILKKKTSLSGRLKSGDESALEEIMDKYTPLASAIIYNIGRGILQKEDIEEAVTDTFISLWKNSSKTDDDTLKGYICCIAKSKAFDKIDSVKRNMGNDFEEEEPADDFSLEGYIEQKAVNEVLGKIVDELGSPDREIVIRYYYYYQKISVIADKLSLSPDNVKTRLYRARAKIKKKLFEGGYFDEE